ncbi:hypothetical protein [Streptomyces tropicalis]|uniref:Bacterial Ig domain-containing protein n=1 Tax=Streptomyces tropicalis TaxID=3034234 RepID=A0ABT6AAF8_9ACTN|nr:hypothetical protein [Streptomyces tropicalis]MDF3301443.1 hypothetical protein [Streptomyces tropicalis]
MNTTFRSHRARALAVCALAATLVSGAPAAAFAASPAPKPSMTRRAASVTLKASHSTVKAGQQVRFTGRTSGIPIGTSVRLQQERNGKWTTLRTSTMVKKGSSFALTARPTAKGMQHYRAMVGKTRSATVTVTVK